MLYATMLIVFLVKVLLLLAFGGATIWLITIGHPIWAIVFLLLTIIVGTGNVNVTGKTKH